MKLDRLLHEGINKVDLPREVVEAFKDLADQQRGEPEKAMLQIQFIMGGGVLSPVVEHTGDLIHRMTEKIEFMQGGYGYVEEKVNKVLNLLESPYGFEEELNENILNNAEYKEIEPEELKRDIDKALREYWIQHRNLPVYNNVQRLANMAAIAVGDKQWGQAITFLKSLQRKLRDREEYRQLALSYELDSSGRPKDIS